MTILPPLPGDPYAKRMEPSGNQTLLVERMDMPINADVSRFTG